MTPPDSPELRCLLVQAGQYLCALPLVALRRVERGLTVHPLPGGPPQLLGLAEFAGEPLPVLDLGRLVGAPPGATPQLPVTIVAWAGHGDEREAVGLAADAALAIAAIPAGPWPGEVRGLVRGEVALGGQLVRVIDPAWLESAG